MQPICWKESAMAEAATLPRNGGAAALLVLHVARIELAAFLRHPLSIFWTLVYPLILFLLMNAIFGRPAAEGTALSYTDYLITGIAMLNVVGTSLFSFVLPLIKLRAQSRLRLLAAMPLPNEAFFAGFAVSRLLVLGAFSGLFLFALSHLAPHGAALSLGRTLSTTAFLVAGAVVFTGLGIVLASVIQRTGTAHAVTNILNVPLIFLSDLFLPTALFPAWMQRIAELSPVYVFVQALREIYTGQMPLAQQSSWMLALLSVGLLLIVWAGRRFGWTPPANG
ncbi:ABC transporter permease [Verminephrobacter eiseniae]|nr:ABC transporter permease [Verminephrobacter eiseniae]MCW5302052.1 ABC transporter permease [Verminephrobacter eiseniae]MCW8179566.1 ABC transporter permease [Verminephrobacter eiseniae]MCW8191021.1 ABC transporter permease [Verminephrobacter eiseniae]